MQIYYKLVELARSRPDLKDGLVPAQPLPLSQDLREATPRQAQELIEKVIVSGEGRGDLGQQ